MPRDRKAIRERKAQERAARTAAQAAAFQREIHEEMLDSRHNRYGNADSVPFDAVRNLVRSQHNQHAAQHI